MATGIVGSVNRETFTVPYSHAVQPNPQAVRPNRIGRGVLLIALAIPAIPATVFVAERVLSILPSEMRASAETVLTAVLAYHFFSSAQESRRGGSRSGAVVNTLLGVGAVGFTLLRTGGGAVQFSNWLYSSETL